MRSWTLGWFKGHFRDSPRANLHPVLGGGGSPGCLGCHFAAPGPHLCPWIFSENFLAAPAAWDKLVSEISRPFTPLTARVAMCRGTHGAWPLAKSGMDSEWYSFSGLNQKVMGQQK